MEALTTLVEQRAKVFTDMEALADKVTSEKRGFTNDEVQQRERMEREFADLTDKIEDAKSREEQRKLMKADQELLEQQKRQLAKASPKVHVPGAEDAPDVMQRYADVFENKLIRNISLTPEESQLVNQFRDQTHGPVAGTQTDAAGGYVIPKDHSRRIEAAMKLAGPFPGIGQVVGTTTTGVFEYPVTDDTANMAGSPGEAQQITAVDFVFDQRRLQAYPYPALAIASWRMVSDSQFDFGNWLTGALGERVGRKLNHDVILGAGPSADEATGIIGTLTGSGVAAGAAGAIAVQDIINLYFSVDASYRNRQTAGFVMNSQTLGAIVSAQLTQSNDQVMYRPALNLGEPATLMNVPVYISEYMPDVGTGNASVAFGDWNSGLVIRMVNGITVQILRERYADKGAVGYLAYTHMDSMVLQAAALNVLVHP